MGIGLGAAAMRWPAVARSVPLVTGIVVVVAGCLQLSGWKARHLRRCRDGGCELPPTRTARDAWRHGLGFGVDCARCCSGWMAILLVGGVMDVGVMALVASAITFERYAARPERAARIAGMVAVTAGMVVIARALWLG
jgi:predicted metal-binding membrane protein